MSDSAAKPSAFVIQMFDGGKFDRRYQETIRSGIINGGAEPQRADEILGVTPIIQKIEEAIRRADICVAEVSVDNPNVWLELGYALALGKPTVILCDRSLRDRLPFDVQHRPVVFYSTDSRSGYDDLERRITAEIRELSKVAADEEKQPILQTGASDTNDLRGYEVSILAALLATWSSSPVGASRWEIDRKLDKTAYSETDISIGLSRLLTLGYIDKREEQDRDEPYCVYRILPSGIRWIQENERSIRPLSEKSASVMPDFIDEDIPF